MKYGRMNLCRSRCEKGLNSELTTTIVDVKTLLKHVKRFIHAS